MTEKLDLTSMKDLINLTFCCQQATVITDFSDLATVGRSHYLNTHGGCASTEELEHLDGEETAILLIEGNKGTVTRYGVVYDNGMQLSQLYDGKHLPGYHYEADMIMVGLVSRQEPENTKNVTWIYLPASKGQIERAIQRSGIVDSKDMCFRMGDTYTGWGEIEPRAWVRYLPLQQEVKSPLLTACSMYWAQLQKENAPLRIYLNGRLQSAPETIYDSFILRELDAQPDEFMEAHAIGTILGKYQLGIGDVWIALRIEQFIREGMFEVLTIPEPDRPIYRRMLRKTKGKQRI